MAVRKLQIFVFRSSLLIRQFSDLNHPVNKLSELSSTDEALDKLDASLKPLLFNVCLPVRVENGFSDLWVNLAEGRCFNSPL